MEARKRVPDDPCLKDISHYVGVILRALIFQGMGCPASLQIDFFLYRMLRSSGCLPGACNASSLLLKLKTLPLEVFSSIWHTFNFSRSPLDLRAIGKRPPQQHGGQMIIC